MLQNLTAVRVRGLPALAGHAPESLNLLLGATDLPACIRQRPFQGLDERSIAELVRHREIRSRALGLGLAELELALLALNYRACAIASA